jgi:hypothetical protein
MVVIIIIIIIFLTIILLWLCRCLFGFKFFGCRICVFKFCVRNEDSDDVELITTAKVTKERANERIDEVSDRCDKEDKNDVPKV